MIARRTAIAFGLLAGLVLVLAFGSGFIAGNAVGRSNGSSAEANDPNLRDFLTAYNLVTKESYFKPLNRHQLVYAAIDGMLSATGDPHTIFLSPTENRTASVELNGQNYAGIGAIVQPTGRALEILSLVPNAPAARAHLRVGDEVVRIGGKSVAGLSGDGAVNRIHGKAGTFVSLTVVRGHGAPFVVRVRRQIIPAITAYGSLLPHHLGEIKILSFGDTTATEVRHALLALRAQHVRGIVVDLRQNPGGYVQAAQQIVSDFLSRGVVAYEQSSNHHLTPLKVLPGHRIVKVPVAVLVDDGTASAAEITAAALREEDHALLIGTRTYGKGSMQSVYALPDGSTVRITDRLWLTPDHHSINGRGLTPDRVVLPGNSPTHDPQQDAAIRALSGGAK